MFDIHIFTLYSLNQTILKKWRRKGKVRDMVVMEINAILHSEPTNMVTGYGACWKT